MSMTTPIVDFVRSYAQSGTARLHMPGHKGQSLLGFEPLDITEICGAAALFTPWDSPPSLLFSQYGHGNAENTAWPSTRVNGFS